jgi:hypothetical protein
MLVKKLLYLFIASTILISCESNEEEQEVILDPIIGTWQIESVIYNKEDITNDCHKKTEITFSEAGIISGTTSNYSWVNVYENGILISKEENCETESVTSFWKNIDSSTYIFDNENVELSLSQNNTIFTLTTTDIYSEVTTYKKI